MNIPQSGKAIAHPFAVKFISQKVLETLFRPGRNLRGIVTQDLGEGKFVFRVAKYNLVATSIKPLFVGQQVRVLVQENKPKLRLKINPEKDEAVPKDVKAKPKSEEKTQDVPCLYLKLDDAEHVEESRFKIENTGKKDDETAAVAFVLHLQNPQTGASRYQFRKTENMLFLDIFTGNFPWFQKLRSDMSELKDFLQARTDTPTAVTVNLSPRKSGGHPAQKNKDLNIKI